MNYNNKVYFDLDKLMDNIKSLRESVKSYEGGEIDIEHTKSELKDLESFLIDFDQHKIWDIINFLEKVRDGEINVMTGKETAQKRIETLMRYSIVLSNKPKNQPIEVYISQIVDSYPDALYPSQSKQSSKDSADKIYKKEELEKISAEELNEILTNHMNNNSNKEKELSDLEQKKELIQKILEEQKRGAELDKQISEKTSEISAMIKGE